MVYLMSWTTTLTRRRFERHKKKKRGNALRESKKSKGVLRIGKAGEWILSIVGLELALEVRFSMSEN